MQKLFRILFAISIVFIVSCDKIQQADNLPFWLQNVKWYGKYSPIYGSPDLTEVELNNDTLRIYLKYDYNDEELNWDTTYLWKIHHIPDSNFFYFTNLGEELIDSIFYIKNYYSFVDIKGKIALKIDNDYYYTMPYYLFPNKQISIDEPIEVYKHTLFKGYSVGDTLQDISNFEVDHYDTHKEYTEKDESSLSENLIIYTINENIIFQIEYDEIYESDTEYIINSLNDKFNTPNKFLELDSVYWGKTNITQYRKKCQWNNSNVKLEQKFPSTSPDAYEKLTLTIYDKPIQWLISTLTERKKTKVSNLIE